ncbi:acetyl/propionyl/methylcrotonyl-CoA carboxylase subunit alpha [Aureimonas sp. OT7]|uniref:acetyl-CoA carboxylase biotin carboxylase subunit n=1 Tax=Aureimonas sp. OT7 TaxID=2816454 RepID=UPI001783819E|nr:acetyl/propionyl/methylcrotonyl-CoA carboxylase subunit alpha [Aureimonas sp. OT7]QOG06690.1 acetyl/propionyl/methylcrotonyl-CoA carboxylase subunit alpha [Aureimonas sp. OT7]
MFKKILIANRGEIACRVIRTAKRMGIATVAVHSDADRDAVHVRMADEAVSIGPAPSAQSYLSIDAILSAIAATGADAVHPGYGFLSENAAFARALDAAGVAFVGPPATAIDAMGDKITSKKLAAEAGVSTVPGHMGLIETAEEAVSIADRIGYPVMIKASAGGGGKGMRIAWNAEEARQGFVSSRSEARGAFGDERIFIEKFVEQPRHIEIQVLGDRHGTIIHLGERECSIQRRNQKVLEEAPSPFLDDETRAAMGAQAVALAAAVGYHSAGTVEFIVDGARNFYFLEMNTRLQVEHPVTELVTGLDLVEEMIRIAAGEPLRHGQGDISAKGWAMEARIYAEDPYRNFLPSIGRLTRYRPPREGVLGGVTVRNDTGVTEGSEISMYYDPMIAKLCTHAATRAAAIDGLAEALDGFELEGIGHNLPFLSAVTRRERFRSGALTTGFIVEEFPDGFTGVEPTDEEARRLAAIAGLVRSRETARAARITGTIAHYAATAETDLVVTFGNWRFHLTIGETVRFEDGPNIGIASDWKPGDTLSTFVVDGMEMRVKTSLEGGSIRLRWRGIDIRAHARRPRVAELAELMPHKPAPDTSRLLLCPMPGVVTAIAVREGDAVEAGQVLATVEAMKMENVLRAERRAVVKRIAAEPGASLAVDELILEFEA